MGIDVTPWPALDLDAITGESDAVDFKVSFDPQSKQDWCELIKDIVAMTNSGGGTIIVGVADDGTSSGADVAPLLAVDSADVTNKIHGYTGQHFASFEISEGTRSARSVAVIRIGPSRIPIVFTAHGGYPIQGGQKTAFVKGSVYFRHGSKSEPGTTDDLRLALERELAVVKEFWLQGIGKVMAAPVGSSVQVIQQDVTLREEPGATAIRLTTDESAPSLSVVQADKLYPYRQKELVNRLVERLGTKIVTTHDLQCVRRVYSVDDNPNFSHQSQWSPRKYSEAFVDWLVEQHNRDPNFFQKAREAYRSRAV
jgi:hypothetical protein